MSENTLDKLLTNTFPTNLPDAKISVECRDIPFTLLTNILSRVVGDLREEMVESRTALAQAMSQLAQEDGQSQDWNALFSVATPALGRAIGSVPDIASDMLLRILVGSTVEHVDALTVNDAAHLLGVAFERMDTDALGRSLKQIFSKAAAAWAQAKPQAEAPVEAIEEEPVEEKL